MSDIVERLRVVPSCWCDEPLDRWESQAERFEAAGLIEQQRDEIERLRALITAYADADDAYYEGLAAKLAGNQDPETERAAFMNAYAALRKAVGR